MIAYTRYSIMMSRVKTNSGFAFYAQWLVGHCCQNGYTALHIAAKMNRVDIAKILLRYGARSDAQSKVSQFRHYYYYSAMHFSAKRGIAIACRLSVRLSVCPSVCNVGEL